MGRIGLALVVLIGLGAVAQATRPYCPTVQLEAGGADIDKTGTRPMPQITSLVLSRSSGQEMISMSGSFEPDVTTIRVSTSGGYSLTTTPKQLHVCSDSNVLQNHEHVTIVAYDKDGHASQPFESDVDVMVESTHPVEEPHHRDHHGMDILIMIGAIILAGMELVGLVLIGFARKKAPYSVAGELLTPILAENVARAVARGYSIKFSVALVITLGLAALHHPYIAILVVPFVVAWLFELFLTRLVIGQFDNKIQRLEKRENWIYINSSKLYAPYKIWEKASALPSAGLAKRD